MNVAGKLENSNISISITIQKVESQMLLLQMLTAILLDLRWMK